LSAQTPHACAASLARATGRGDPLGSREHQVTGENGSEDERYRIVGVATWQCLDFVHACRVGRRRHALNAGWHSESKKRFGRYEISSSRELDDEMFDIVNREYEENGSFRCDFVATKERDRELVVMWFCRFYPCASRRTVS